MKQQQDVSIAGVMTGPKVYKSDLTEVKRLFSLLFLKYAVETISKHRWSVISTHLNAWKTIHCFLLN